MTIRSAILQVVDSWFHGYANMWCDTEEETALVDEIEQAVLKEWIDCEVDRVRLVDRQTTLTVNGIKKLLEHITAGPMELEYITVTDIPHSFRDTVLQATANHWGREGWEVVSVWPITNSKIPLGYSMLLRRRRRKEESERESI